MPTLSTGDPGECICIEVLAARSVNYVEVIFLQLFQPSGKLALWIPKASQRSERSMVCLNYKVLAQEVHPEVLYEGHNC